MPGTAHDAPSLLPGQATRFLPVRPDTASGARRSGGAARPGAYRLRSRTGRAAAPALEHFGRRSYIAGQLPNTPETLQRRLLDPPGLLPGTTMPRLGLSERDARDIAGYLMSLR